jgi:methionine biosynthesis protein MetW
LTAGQTDEQDERIMHEIHRKNFPIIEDWIEPGSQVLDLGCGDGTLLSGLVERKHVEAVGVEISDEMIVRCLQKGISVYQADIDRGLCHWHDRRFDYVILNDTLQVITRPHEVIGEMLRVGRYALVSVSNFAYVGNRLRVLLKGRMSRAILLSGSWHDTPVIRFVSLKEFRKSLYGMGVEIVDARYFLAFSLVVSHGGPLVNLLARNCIFKLRRAHVK